MRMTGFVLAGALLMASPAYAGEKDPARVSMLAGSFGGVAESCGLLTKEYGSRVNKLLRYMVKHMDGNYSKSEAFIDSYNSMRKKTYKQQLSQRTIDCEDAKREFENLSINQPGWTVKTGWHS